MAAFLFYLLTVYLPRKRCKEKMLDIVADHLVIMRRNVENFYDTIGYPLNPNPDDYEGDLALRYDGAGLHEQQFPFSLNRYPFGGYSGRYMTTREHLEKYAGYAWHSIREIKRSLPDESGSFRQALDHGETMCMQVENGDGYPGSYSLLMNNLLGIVNEFINKYGPLE